MARHLTQTLTLTLTLIKQITPKSTIPPLIPPLSHRFLSSKPPQLLEFDLDSSSSSSSSSDGGGEIEVMGLKRLEDAIHGVIVRRLAPDWLPFRPGSSYWVPPKGKGGNIMELIGKLTNHSLSDEEESLSISSSRGWPCSSFFIQHDSEHQIPVEVEVQVQVCKSPDEKVSEDEE